MGQFKNISDAHWQAVNALDNASTILERTKLKIVIKQYFDQMIEICLRDNYHFDDKDEEALREIRKGDCITRK